MHVLKFPLSWKLYLVKLLMQKVILECIFDVYIILSVLFFTYINCNKISFYDSLFCVTSTFNICF